MLRLICCLFLIGLLAPGKSLIADDVANKDNAPLLDARNDYQQIWGDPTNGLQPAIILGYSAGWDVCINLLAQEDFPGHMWLAISNRVGSRVELWRTNGTQVLSKDADVLNAFHLPKHTTVSEIVQGVHPRNKRGMQWWRLARPTRAQTSAQYRTVWTLQSAFEMSPTNDYVLKISPLIYKVETNEVTAHLVEFPHIAIKLMTDGRAQRIP